MGRPWEGVLRQLPQKRAATQLCCRRGTWDQPAYKSPTCDCHRGWDSRTAPQSAGRAQKPRGRGDSRGHSRHETEKEGPAENAREKSTGREAAAAEAQPQLAGTPAQEHQASRCASRQRLEVTRAGTNQHAERPRASGKPTHRPAQPSKPLPYDQGAWCTAQRMPASAEHPS